MIRLLRATRTRRAIGAARTRALTISTAATLLRRVNKTDRCCHAMRTHPPAERQQHRNRHKHGNHGSQNVANSPAHANNYRAVQETVET
jgi:hypothetical protein